MTTVILAVLALFVVQTLLPASFRYLFAGPGVAERLKVALGPRDNQPKQSILGERAERALGNMFEALPVFLTLALLCIFSAKENAMSLRGAQIFLLARMMYVPAYLSGLFGFRSIVWSASWVGLVLMLISLLHN